MSPEKEAEIRTLVIMRYGVDARKVFDCLEELLAEIDELRARQYRTGQQITGLKHEVEELTDEVSGLRESLRIYGDHMSSCRYTLNKVGGPCHCGFREVFKKAIRNIDGDRTEDFIDPNPKPGSV